MPRIRDFCICMYVFGCRLSLVTLCDSDFGITPVDDITIGIIIIIITYLLTYLLQLSFHSVAVVLTLVQTKQKIINIHKRNNTKTQYKQYKNTVYTSTHITKTPTQLSKHPPHTHTHTLQNRLKLPQYMIHIK